MRGEVRTLQTARKSSYDQRQALVFYGRCHAHVVFLSESYVLLRHPEDECLQHRKRTTPKKGYTAHASDLLLPAFSGRYLEEEIRSLSF